MITRKDYLKGKASHHDYYVEIAKDVGIKPDEETLEKVRRALDRGDEHLNTISMKFWDMWAVSVLAFNRERVWDAFKRRGDYPTQAGLVSMLKNICIYYCTNASKARFESNS